MGEVQKKHKDTTNYTTAQKQKRARRPSMTYMNSAQRKMLIKTTSDAGALLYSYYLEKAGVQNFEFTDEAAAETLGWSLRKVQNTRRELTKTDWFYQDSFSSPKGKKLRVTYLGQETVRANKDPSMPVWEKLNKLAKLQEQLEAETIEDILGNVAILEEAKELWHEMDEPK